MERLGDNGAEATRVQSVASDAKCYDTSALSGWFALHFGHRRLGTVWGTVGPFLTAFVEKTEENEARATVLLTVAHLR